MWRSDLPLSPLPLTGLYILMYRNCFIVDRALQTMWHLEVPKRRYASNADRTDWFIV